MAALRVGASVLTKELQCGSGLGVQSAEFSWIRELPVAAAVVAGVERESVLQFARLLLSPRTQLFRCQHAARLYHRTDDASSSRMVPCQWTLRPSPLRPQARLQVG